MTSEVRDYYVETWIKVVGLLLAIAVPMVGAMGSLMLYGQHENTKEIQKMSKEVSRATALFEGYGIQIKRNTDDIKDMGTKVNTINDRVFSLEGEWKSWKRQ